MKNTTTAELRAKAEQMSEDIADMNATINRMADKHGWDDPQVAALDEDITQWEARYHHLLAQLKRARSGRAA